MIKKILFAVILFACTAFGDLHRIYYDHGWKVEKIITGVDFSNVEVDRNGTVYMTRTSGGLGAIWKIDGNWMIRSDLGASAGAGIYSHIDARSANHLYMIGDDGLERTLYGNSGWTNQNMAAASYNAMAVDQSQPAYYIAVFLANSGGGLDRHNFYKGEWRHARNIGGAANTYVDVESKPGELNHAFMVGAAGLERVWYKYGAGGGWKHEPIISGVSLTCLAPDANSSWKVFTAKADGGLMQACKTDGNWTIRDMTGAGRNVYIDIADIPGEANSLFMVNRDGGLEKARRLGDGLGWANEVIATGNYVALATNDEADSFFAVSESKTGEVATTE